MIALQCGEKLSQEFINSRLKVLKDTSDPYTEKFRELYGDPYWKALMGWFERAKTDMI